MTDDLKAPERPMWCDACRAAGAFHCAHPDECGNMLSATGAADNWKAWLDDIPLDSIFDPAICRLQDFISALVARIATLEAALADMTRQRDAAIKSLADVREETIRLNTATDAQYAKTVAKLREERDAAMAAAEAQAEARGIRKAAEHFADNALGRTITSIHRGILALADATEAAAKGGA